MPEARRTLVKSPPELWAEVSDPESLARHLAAFGEVRIVRAEPESTVAWEGDRARGTVELAASGWGTKVTLTAEPLEPEAETPVEPEADAPIEPETEAPVELETPAQAEEPPIADEVAAAQRALDSAEQSLGAAAQSLDAGESALADEEPPRRGGFLARLFRRRAKGAAAAAEARAPERAAAEAEPPVAESEPRAAEAPATDAEPPAAEADPPAAEAEPPAAETDPPAPHEPPPAPVEEPAVAAGDITVSRLADDEAAAVLDGMLDTLGAAHHRPFSR